VTDRVDQYGRLLRYIVRVADGLNVNVQVVRVGAAAPYFYEGRRGRYAALLERLALRGSDFFVFLRGGVCAEIRCARRSSARTVARLTLTTAEHAAAAGLDSAERLRGRAVSPVHAWTVEYQHTNVALPAPARPRRGSLLRRLSGRML
jgi:hypothetical protein